MLAGRRAFEKPTPAETMAAILNEEPPAISELAPNTPPPLVRIVKRCLDKDPEQRFQSASDLAFALQALAESSSAVPGKVIEPVIRAKPARGSRSRPRWWEGCRGRSLRFGRCARNHCCVSMASGDSVRRSRRL